MRYFVELSYNGGRYCGWQRQRDAASVQETLERALSTLLREPVEVTGAGRTDTGVHAAYAVAHFDVAAPLTDPEHTVYKLNCLLPDDVAVFGVAPVADDAHARFSAAEREVPLFHRVAQEPLYPQGRMALLSAAGCGANGSRCGIAFEYDDFSLLCQTELQQQDQYLPHRAGRLGGVARRSVPLYDPCRPFSAQYGAGAGWERWSTWGAGVTMWRSSARSSRAATCRARAAARRPKDFICGTSPTLPECSGAGNGRETCCLTKIFRTMGTILYLVGLVCAVLAVLDIFKKNISTVGKVIASVLVLLTSWVGCWFTISTRRIISKSGSSRRFDGK